MRKTQLENETGIKDAKLQISKSFEDQIERLNEQVRKVGNTIDTKFGAQDEVIENVKQEIQGFSFKQKQAI